MSGRPSDTGSPTTRPTTEVPGPSWPDVSVRDDYIAYLNIRMASSLQHEIVLYDLGVIDLSDDFLIKAEESLAGAECELANGRFNNCANRCYYAVFQAAIHALVQAGIRPPGRDAEWSHEFVRSNFVGLLVNRRKIYPTSLRTVLEQNRALRRTADYKRDRVSEVQAQRAVRRTRELLAAVRERGARR